MREMYLTARRQTSTEPHTMPESLGFSQYTRELIWSGLGHMLTRLGMAHCTLVVTVCGDDPWLTWTRSDSDQGPSNRRDRRQPGA